MTTRDEFIRWVVAGVMLGWVAFCGVQLAQEARDIHREGILIGPEAGECKLLYTVDKRLFRERKIKDERIVCEGDRT